MNQETKQCQNCKKEFVIESDDFEFYKKIKVPSPAWCPECRLVKRLSWRNERALYKRKCDLCGQDKVLLYPSGSPYEVYCYSCWWSDNWEPESYAKDYDFSKPFFEQFKELFLAVPRVGIIQQGHNVNSDYTNRSADNKNCYMVFAVDKSENCSYGTSFWSAKDSMDCYNIHTSELCFECIDCYDSNHLIYSQECNSCTNSAFLLNCKNCSDCFGCVNLRNKSYCFFNEQLTKDEYKERLLKIQLGNRKDVEKLQEQFSEFSKGFIVPALVENHSTDVSGNWLDECKNIKESFNCSNTEDGKYLFAIQGAKDCMDFTYWGMPSELIYECVGVGRQCSQVLFSIECWDQLIRSQYCTNCHSSSDLFGCIGLRKKQYCIFNKQYPKEEYEALVPKIIEHMNNMPYEDSLGREWRYGSTVPLDIHTFAYNETAAQEFFPILKEDAEKQGYRWIEPEKKNHKITLKAEDVPDSIEKVDEKILEEVISCAHKGKCNHQCTEAFKITPGDLNFYKRIGIPIPQLCPNCRHFARLAVRTPIKLWQRKCMCDKKNHFHGEEKCPNKFETSYAPDKPETVYCKQCYQSEVA